MHHRCPDCLRACYCNGDVDDCEVKLRGEERCEHCDDDWPEDDDDREYIDDDEEPANAD